MKHRTYDDIKPRNRINELELIAFAKMTGEDVENTLESIDPKLKVEYSKLSYGDEE